MFDKKIRINEGLVEEELEPLSPKQLIDKTFEEIYEDVVSHLDAYFDIAEKQFKTASNISILEEKGQTKVIKPNTPQSSEN